MIKEVKIPEISENVESGTVIQVLVEVGDMIDIDDVLVEFETEKALVEIPSTVKGKITELLAKKGDEMSVGDVIARVDTEDRAEDKETAEPEPAADDSPNKEGEKDRKLHEDCRALTLLAVQPQPPPVHFDPAHGPRQPEPASASGRAMREERIHRSLGRVRVHAAAVVLHPDHDPLIGRIPLAVYDQAGGPTLHRFGRISDQLIKRRLNLRGIH